MSTRTTNDQTAGRDAEAGFTLVEMVIAVVLLTLMLGAISAAFVSSMNATSSTKNRTNLSNDAQLISAFLTRDAQAAGGTDPQTGVADPTLGVTSGAFATATGCTAPPGNAVLGLKWIDRSSGTTYAANYSYIDPATADATYQDQQFLRTICSVPAVGATDSATSVLANNVVSSTSGSLSVPKGWCDSNRPPASPACPLRFPATVSLGVSVNKANQNLNPPFSFILTASLRSQSGQADLGDSATTASLMLLGGSNCLYASSASFNLTIYGSTALSGCIADLKKDADPFGPVFVSAPGTCASFPASPPCVVVNSTISDPFQTRINSGALTAPDASGCSGAAPAVGSNGHWQPGTYPSDPQASGTTRTFDPGIYVFCNGLTGDVTANLQGGPIGGTFFYFAGGTYDVCLPFSDGCQSDVLITPPTSGQYKGLAIWQKKQDPASTPEMIFSKGLTNITGTVYAPSAIVGLKNGAININQLIAYGIDGNPGNPDVHIGPPLRVFLTQNPLPVGTVGVPYSGFQANAVDGTGVYSNWSISPSVPGLTINANTGAVTGTPTSAGTYNITFTVHDNDGEVATATAALTIYPALTISGSLPDWTINRSGYPSNPLTAGGGSGTGYTWSASVLPTGLSMDATGTISGTPTALGAFAAQVILTDSIGNTKTLNQTVNILNPPTITGVQLNNVGAAGNAGKISKGDQVIVTFSQTMAVNSFCNTWSGNTTNQSISSNGTVVVKVVNGTVGANDSLVVQTASGCAFNFGSIDLGSTGYVTADQTYSGNSGNASTIAWNATTNALTITIGNGTTTPASAITNTTPKYTSAAAITDSTGATISNSPVTLAAGTYF